MNARLVELSQQLGQQVEGRVTSVVSLGAFVDLGGADGLLHVDDMSWGGEKDPQSFVWVGQVLRVTVVSVDLERKRVALSTRRAGDDPWKWAAARYTVGARVRAKVVSHTALSNGHALFVRLEPWVDALLLPGDLPAGKLATDFPLGDFVQVTIQSVDTAQRRISAAMDSL